MRLEIVFASQPSHDAHDTESRAASRPGANGAPSSEPAAWPRAAHDVLAVFMDGPNVTARVREKHGAFVLRDLALALVDLSRLSRGKRAVRLYDQPWELCVERFAGTACLSVYRAAQEPFVAVYERVVTFDDVIGATSDIVERMLAAGDEPAAARLELESALRQLGAIAPTCADPPKDVPAPVPVAIEPDRDSVISFGAEFALREGDASPRALTLADGPALNAHGTHGRRVPNLTRAPFEAVERSDVHALLFRGRIRAEIRGHSIDLGECHPVMVAEHLVDVARRAFDAWERGLPLHSRGEAVGLVIDVRVSADGELALTLAPSRGAGRAAHTFPALGVVDFLEAVLTFGRSLVRSILRRDRSQSANLRLSSFRRVLRESAEALRHASQSDAKVNPTPDPYRAFATALAAAAQDANGVPPANGNGNVTGNLNGSAASRLRFAPRWRAIVPGIDLRSTYLCGDRVVAGAASEMWALDRADGRVLWRTDIARGTSVVTPAGIARLAPDGSLAVHDFATGECVMRARIAPRIGGSVAGAVVNLPGLPRLVIVTEGEHHLVAIDLGTGETRWRWSWGAAHGGARGAPRIKRAGRLLYFTCGDGALTALDVTSGAVVWRVRDRLRFRTPPTVAHDALFIVAGGAHGVACLYCIDPYSGVIRWTRTLGESSASYTPYTVEGPVLVAGCAVGVATRTARSKSKPCGSALELAMFRRDDGAPVTGRRTASDGLAPGAPVGTSWLAVDDTFIGNMPTGEIVGVDARSGQPRWHRVLGPRPLEADVPRRLEPVLRCGALFVPCSLLSPMSGFNSHWGGPLPSRIGSGRVSGATERTERRQAPQPPVEAAAGVCILRPADGAQLGAIAPTEAIPDLLRVDEHCNVYVAEESGHIAAFAALPRLTLLAT